MKEITLVPKDKCPLRFIREIEERANNPWIFLHNNVLEKLISSANQHATQPYGSARRIEGHYLIWDDASSSRELLTAPGKEWFRVIFFLDNGDKFLRQSAADPEEIFFLKMDE